MFFFSFRIFFSDNTRVRIFFLSHKARIFFPKCNIRLYFFFLHQNQNIFFSNIGNQNIFLERNHNPPPPFKLNGRSLKLLSYVTLSFLYSERPFRKEKTYSAYLGEI